MNDKKEKTLLFIGGIYNDMEFIEKHNIGKLQTAADVFQKNLVEGFLENSTIKMLNTIFIGSYPKKFSKILIPATRWSWGGNEIHLNTMFINFPVIKQITKYTGLVKNLKHWNVETKGEKKAIIIYSAHTPFLLAATRIKKINQDIELVLIVPDLPEFMNLSQKKKLYYNILKKIDRIIINKLLLNIDKFVLLTKQMNEKINIKNRPFLVIEGLVKKEEKITLKASEKSKDRNRRIITYTGTLNKKYGIMDLLTAFTEINNPSYELWICGGGEAEVDIKEITKNDSRIKFYGNISRNEVLEIQKKSTVLINPRKDEGEYTKYSFPSKIMEYLASGTPMIGYYLTGMPKEYKKLFYTVQGETIEDLKKCIIEVCEKENSILNEKGKKTRQYILENKNNIIQTKKIIDFIND